MGGACYREQIPEPRSSAIGTEKINCRLTIYGDYFDRDTRALLAICDMAEVDAVFTIVDTFNGGNLEESYVRLNPTKTIPMLRQGPSKCVKGT